MSSGVIALPSGRAAQATARWWRGLGQAGAGDGHCWPSAAQELLLSAALIEGPRGDAAWQQLRSTLDVDALDYTSHAVLPLLYRRLKSAGVDDPMMGILKGLHRYNWARNQGLLEAFVPVLRRLLDAGVAVALLKGAALVATTYADPGLRAMQDVDILVPTAARRTAIEILVSAGLTPVSGWSADAVDHAAPSFTPSFAFRDGLGRELDLHWQVLHKSRQADADDDFWAAMRSATVRGVALQVLDPADQLLHAIAHGLQWNPVPPLRWVIDAITLLRLPAGDFDAMRLVDQARRRCLVVQVREALSYLQQRYDAPVPAAAMAVLARSPTSILERWEAGIDATDPGEHRAIDRALLELQDATRRRTPLGRRPGWRIRLAALAAVRGLDDARQLPADLLLGRPGLPHRPGAGPTAVIAEGSRLLTTLAGGFYRVCGHGWALAEALGTWSIRRRAQIRLMVTARSGLPLALSFAGSVFAGAGWCDQRLTIAINGRPLARWRIHPDRPNLSPARVVVPPTAARASVLDLRFCVARLGSPRRLGSGEDVRYLGFNLHWLAVAPLPSLRPGERLDLSDKAVAEAFLADGWDHAPDGAELGARGRIVLRLAGRRPGRLRLTADLATIPGRPAPRSVSLAVNGRRLARWHPPGESAVDRSAIIPPHLMGADSTLVIELLVDRDPQAGDAFPGVRLSALVIDAAG